MNKIFAIVVTYNGENWIHNCLRSLENSTVPLSIVVVDNCSEDQTVTIIQKYHSSVILLPQEKNLGFGQANNLGIQLALQKNCDYIFLLNQDAWIFHNTISELMQVMALHPEYGIISPFHVLPDMKNIEWYFSNYASPQNCENLLSDIYFDHIKDIYRCDFVNAAAWFISRDCICKVGGFDPIFFHYGEDEDYCARILYHGFKIGICPGALIVHDTRKTKYSDISTSFQRNVIFSLVKIKNVNAKLYINCINFFFDSITRIVKLFLFRRFSSSFLHFRVLVLMIFSLPSVITARNRSQKQFAFLKVSEGFKN